MAQAKDCNTTSGEIHLDDPEAAVVLRGPLSDLQRAAERLESSGIDCAIVRPQQDAAGCCSTTLYLAVARDDVPAAYALFDREWRRGLTPEQLAALDAASDVVLDPDAPETTCPACLTTFATGPAACPDCGLALG
ncbi:MAG TPA: hypothetical protein VEC57_05940 [Candidatus Limnocylindrales bacterium]|nr:hypothetical protein [Candidatus Limnocylindrales bacterium]